MTAKAVLLSGCLGGLLGVIFGAFGSHGLAQRLSPEMLAVWKTAVDYQFVHSLALLAVGLFMIQQTGTTLAAWAAASFVLGILLFSGSLYALALTGIKPLGAVTPFGGLSFILGWGLLMAAVLRLDAT